MNYYYNTKKTFLTLLCIYLSQLLSAQIPMNRPFFIQNFKSYTTGSNKGFWDIPGKNVSFKNGQNLQVWDLTDKLTDRKYTIKQTQAQVSNGTFIICPEYTGMNGVVSAATSHQNNGTNVLIAGRDGSNNQSFKIIHVGDGRYKIYSFEGKVVCLKSKSDANGSNVHLWENHNSPETEWVFLDVNTMKKYIPPVPEKFQAAIYNGDTQQPIAGAKIKAGYYFDGSYHYSETTSNAKGQFNFVEDKIVKYGNLRLKIESSDYGALDKETRKGYKDFGTKILLYPKQGRKVEESLYEGLKVYGAYDGWYYREDGSVVDGTFNYFHDLSSNAPEILNLRNAMGVDGMMAKNDVEILERLSKVWAFWKTQTKTIMLLETRSNEVKAANEYAKSISNVTNKEQWPGITVDAKVFSKYGYILTGACSSQAIKFARLLSLAGIPHTKLAITRFHYNAEHQGEHWSTIVKLNNIWYWFDTNYAFNSSIPSELNSMHCIPKNEPGFDYERPFEVILLAGGKLTKVPLVGERGKALAGELTPSNSTNNEPNGQTKPGKYHIPTDPNKNNDAKRGAAEKLKKKF